MIEAEELGIGRCGNSACLINILQTTSSQQLQPIYAHTTNTKFEVLRWTQLIILPHLPNERIDEFLDKNIAVAQGTPWFVDGNIILQAESTRFKAYHDILKNF